MKTIDSIIEKIRNRFKGSSNLYLVSLVSGLLMLLLAYYRINISNDQSYSQVNQAIMLQYALLLNITSSMAISMYFQIRENKSYKGISLLIGILLPIIAYLVLKSFNPNMSIVYSLSENSVYIILALSLICIIYFFRFYYHKFYKDEFEKAFYMINKAVFSTVLYAIVLLIGLNLIVFAFDKLIYNNLSSNIYAYVASTSLYIAFVIFLSYFTDADKVDFKEVKLVSVLVDKILVSISLTLTVILIIWLFRVLFGGLNVAYDVLSSVILTYVISGMWLYIMITHKTKLTSLYQSIFPFVGIINIVVLLTSLYRHYQVNGLMTFEYGSLLLSIFALVSLLLIVLNRSDKYLKISDVAVFMLSISILPFIGLYELPYNSQVAQLKHTLEKYQMLVSDEIVKSDVNVKLTDQVFITNSVRFINSSSKVNPTWLPENSDESMNFKSIFNFDVIYSLDENIYEYETANLRLAKGIIPIEDYDILIPITDYYELFEPFKFEFNDKDYTITVTKDDAALFTLASNEEVMSQSMRPFFDNLFNKYLSSEVSDHSLDYSQMSLHLENDDVKVLILFNSIYYSKSLNESDNNKNESFQLSGIYITFK